VSTETDQIEVQLCSARDRAEQARLFNACFKKRVTPEALAWRYDQSPHGRTVSLLSRPAGADGISGYACSPRMALSFGDEATLAVVGETGDVMTHPDWRKKGLFSALDRACMQETARQGWPIVFGLPNRRSAHIFLDLGWEEIGSVRPWTFVLQQGAAARAVRAVDGRLKALSVPFAAWSGRRARARLRESSRGLRNLPLGLFPPEVSGLSRAIEKRFAFMVRRDADYLNWRFRKGPSGLHRAIGVYDDSEALVGYAVVQAPRPGDSVGYLVDVLGLDERALATAVEAGLATLEAAGAAVVRATAIDGSWWSRMLAQMAFQPPRPENCLSVILHTHRPEHPLARAARDVRGWYFTDGDRDDETMG
jgi:GNAT superfamily N-acetyltransferase